MEEFLFLQDAFGEMYALVVIGVMVQRIPQDCRTKGAVGRGQSCTERWDTVIIIKLDKKREGRDGGQPGCYKRAKTLFWVEQWCVEAVAWSHVQVCGCVTMLVCVCVCLWVSVSMRRWVFNPSIQGAKCPLTASKSLSLLLPLFTHQPKVTLSLSLLFQTHTLFLTRGHSQL